MRMKDFPFCTGRISRKLCQVLLMFSTSFILLTVFLLFPLSVTFFVVMHTRFFIVLSTIDETLLIKPFTNVFVFGDFNAHHKDWLIYSAGANKPGEVCHNSSVSNDLTQTVNFPTRIFDCDSHSPTLLDLFLSSDANICSTMAFPALEILIMSFAQFPLIFQLIHNRMPHFIT